MRSDRGFAWGRVLFLIAALTLVGVSIFVWWQRVHATDVPSTPDPAAQEPEESLSDRLASPPEASDATGASDETPVATPLELPSVNAWIAAVEQVPAAERAAWIQRWWSGVQGGREPAELRAWLLAFLENGGDLATGLAFRVGPGGALATAPSLRVQVLDWLGDVDPEAAAAYARNILVPSSPPDEWALALRNYGRVLENPSQDAYYIERIGALLAREDWQTQPTGGYLEAFDAAVHSGAGAVVPALLELSLESTHAGTRKAATMALDNLAGDDPLLVARAVNTPASPIAARPTFRASLVSRLDPRDEAHIAEIQHYLLEVPHGADELEVFAQTFPNANDFASHYLLTRQPGRNLYEMAQVDLAAYNLVRTWQEDPSFAPRRDTLAQIETRLRTFLESAVRGGMLKEEDLP